VIRHAIVDRDGVLNVEAPAGGYVLSPDAWVWLPRALDGLAWLHRHGVRVSVATNQSPVGRGLISPATLDAIFERMCKDAAAVGGKIARVYVCPHAPTDRCSCRKPAPALLLEAIAESGIPASETVFIGDAPTDLAAARNAGVQGWLVRTGKGRDTERALAASGPVPTFEDLLAAAIHVVPAC